jgi:hypothetical protein
MVKIKIDSNLLRVQALFSYWISEVSDNSKAFKAFIPEFQKTRVALIGAGRAVDGAKFQRLSPEYAARKKRKYGSKPILVATGKLLGAVAGGSGWRQWVGKKSMTLKVDIPYASYHQEGTQRMPQRNFFLTKDGTLTKMDYAQLLQAMSGNIDDAIKATFGKLEK